VDILPLWLTEGGRPPAPTFPLVTGLTQLQR